jgi:flagellar hook-associated protein 1
MGDMLGNAVSGLLSFQRALTTTSHNISNVNTPGYSRQRVELDTRNPSLMGGNYVGSGVEITNIRRAYDQFITSNLRENTSAHSRLEKFTDLASQIDDILADPQGGLSPVLQEFFTAVQDVNNDPSSGSARYQLISATETLVNRFHTFDTRLENLSVNAETELKTTVEEINQITADIAQINRTLQETNASGDLDQQSSDLLDQRDALLQELSTKVTINVINERENNITVLIGNGQTVVAGASAFDLSVIGDLADPGQNIIVYNGLSGASDISAQLTGGELGGLLDFRNNMLKPAVNSLGRMAIGIADSFNDQHHEGMDLQGNLGGDFFSFAQPQTIQHTANTGTAVVSTSITDISQLTTEDYTLAFDAGVWTVTSTSGSSGIITAPSDTFEGLTFNISGAAASGDKFTIKPTATGAGTIDVAISDPNLIAAAAAVRTGSSLNNLGDAIISQGKVVDATNINLLSTVNITFSNPATDFTSTSDIVVNGTTYLAGTTVPYSKNMLIESNGWQVTLDGDPQPGDVFTIESNQGGVGDNRNGLELLNLQVQGLFDSGTNSYQEAYSVIVGRIGAVTNSAMNNRDAQQALLTQAEDRRNQVSGVNLDEEAADLIKYQQAYEAAARVITIAQTLFQSLIESTR